jgi:drug/metabolite transporter (DMT)-like permease
LTGSVLAIVLVSAVVHAWWNLRVKSADDRLLLLCLGVCGAGALALPVLLASPPPRDVWPYVVASVLAETMYFVALARAYDHADFSVAYPLARGLAPLLLAVWSVLFLGERPGVGAWIGIVAIAMGIITLGLDARLSALPFTKQDTRDIESVGENAVAGHTATESAAAGNATAGLAAAAVCALCISVYSAVDAGGDAA